ncbi:MAG: ATP-binding cassette domain-containing protein [Ferruginibacter sp.]
MKKFQHTAFYIGHKGDKDLLITAIQDVSDFGFTLKELRGEIFSNTVLEHFIEEEMRHDNFEIVAGNNNILANSSSGEQRKALLSYLIQKKPAYLIIDGLFESIDKDSRLSILATLKEISADTLIIQILNRQNELLPFIENIYFINGDLVNTKYNPQEFFEQVNLTAPDCFAKAIPLLIVNYPPQKDPLIEMKHVCVHYDDRPVLQNISWKINSGEFWQLTGPNGSGKSTLLSLITGNSAKGYGQDLVLFGHRRGTGESVWDIKEKIGYFSPAMTMQFERQDSIEQMVISGFYDSVGLYIKPTDRQAQIAREWLSLMGFYKDKDKPFRLYPAGRQRMILIARAMVKHPPLLILDEPTAGLDDEMAALFVSLVNKIAKETNSAIVYVSHREEPGLTPAMIFELSPHENGSRGLIRKQNLTGI